MASWSQRRKSIYGGIVVVVALAVIGVPAFFIFYKAPSCTDGIQNGSETGVDCGGSCTRLCASAFFPPSVSWTRLQKIAPSLYNVGTYIINPNTSAVAMNVPYHVTIYDGSGIQITEYTGMVTLPPKRNTLAFDSAISVGKREPLKALFEFTSAPDWRSQNDPLGAVGLSNMNFSEDSNSSSFTVNLNNTSVNPIGPTDVYVILYDKDKNAIGFSKTKLDGIPALGSSVAPFTWPVSFGGAVVSEDVLPVAE